MEISQSQKKVLIISAVLIALRALLSNYISFSKINVITICYHLALLAVLIYSIKFVKPRPNSIYFVIFGIIAALMIYYTIS